MRELDESARREASFEESSSSEGALPFKSGVDARYASAGLSNASGNPWRHEMSGFRRIVPLACLSLQEHAYMVDHGVWGKQEYVKAWLRAVDWEVIESRMFYKGEKEGGGKQIFDTTVGKDWNQ